MRRAAALLLATFLLAGCQQESGPGRAASAGAAYPEAEAMLGRGEFDAVLGELAGASDAEALYLMGQAWVGKAGGDRRTLSGSLGPEEMQALDLFQQAAVARPDLVRAHLAIAELLAPYALAAAEAPPAPADPAPTGSAVSVDRVLAAYAAAVQADPAATAPVESLIGFALKADRKAEAAAGFRELTQRDRENPELLVRYGDFLAGPGGSPEEALGVYGQALIWRADDEATHLKIADIHIDAALVQLEADAYAAADARLREARKHVKSEGSAQARRLKDAEHELARASGRR